MKIPNPIKLYRMMYHEEYSMDAKYVIKPVSCFMTWVLLHLGVSANMVTWIMLMMFLKSVILFARGYFILGIVCLFVGWVLDGSDGEVAQFRQQYSYQGKFLDSVSHGIFTFVFLGLGIGCGNIGFGILASIFHLLNQYMRYSYFNILAKIGQKYRPSGLVQKMAMGNYDFPITLLIFVFILVGDVNSIVTILGILMPIKWVVNFRLIKFREEGKRLGQSY